MGYIVFGDNKTAARLFVETMDDAWSLFPADSRQGRAVIQERVNQSVFAMTSARVDDKSRRLINDDQVVIFEENLKRDRLWQRFDLFQWRLGELNLIAASNDLTWPAVCVVESNKPIADQLLEA
jgi:hypothetical protein